MACNTPYFVSVQMRRVPMYSPHVYHPGTCLKLCTQQYGVCSVCTIRMYVCAMAALSSIECECAPACRCMHTHLLRTQGTQVIKPLYMRRYRNYFITNLSQMDQAPIVIVTLTAASFRNLTSRCEGRTGDPCRRQAPGAMPTA